METTKILSVNDKKMTINEEVQWDKTQILTSKTDALGNIEYANETFVKVSGYEDHELMGKPHNIIRHPDMPKIIFKLLWDSLKKGENFHAVIKNKAKSGRYYWVVTDFEVSKDDSGKIINYFGRRKSISDSVVDKYIKPIYSKLLLIERESGLETSEKYLRGLFEDKGITYNDFIQRIIQKSMKENNIMNEFEQEMINEQTESKNFFKKFFKLK